MAGDYPGIPFVQARYYTRGRLGAGLRWIVMHTMEAHELPTTAESTANYFANPGDGRTVSSHLCCDNNSVVQCVLEKDTAYTAGGNPGNPGGFNVEQAGFASQTRAQWLDDYSIAMFKKEAPILNDVAERNDIPFRYVNWQGLRAGLLGFTTHNDCRLAWGGTTHWDPGESFPWDVFLEIVEDDVSLTTKQNARLMNNSQILGALAWGRDLAVNLLKDDGSDAADIPLTRLYDRIANTSADAVIRKLAEGGWVTPGGEPIDAAVVAAAAKAGAVEGVKDAFATAQVGVTFEDTE